MPLIQVKVIENVFDAGQKREIIERLTDAMVEVEGENLQRSWKNRDSPARYLSPAGSFQKAMGIAGNALSTADVKGLQAGVAA